MRSYEALVILRVSGTEQELAKAASKLEEPIKRMGGGVQQTQTFGRRKLAFRIARQAEGYYQLLRFQAPTQQVEALERVWRLDENILRFLIVTTEAPASAAGGRTAGAAADARKRVVSAATGEGPRAWSA